MNYNPFHHLIMHQKNRKKNKKQTNKKNRIRILKILQLTWAHATLFPGLIICKEAFAKKGRAHQTIKEKTNTHVSSAQTF